MGQVSSCLRRHHSEDDVADDSFDEVERRKTRDGDRRRRHSSGLSRYSTDSQHVFKEPLKVAAFNIKRFGAAKMKDKEVVSVLTRYTHYRVFLRTRVLLFRIISEFDLVVVQEIVDTSEKAIHDLTAAVNNDYNGAGDTSAGYNVVISPRLGRTSQKEQYAIIYR